MKLEVQKNTKQKTLRFSKKDRRIIFLLLPLFSGAAFIGAITAIMKPIYLTYGDVKTLNQNEKILEIVNHDPSGLAHFYYSKNASFLRDGATVLPIDLDIGQHVKIYYRDFPILGDYAQKIEWNTNEKRIN